MKAVIYPRISKEEQSVYSIGEQIKQCREYCEKEQYDIVDTYIDEGYSAKDLNRPSMQRLLSDIDKKKFDIVVVWKLDRLTRDTLDGLSMVKTMFKPNGIDFASVTEDIDTSTPDGMMMLTIRLSMAQNEREKIAERVALGQVARAKTGKRNSSARPFGYNVDDDLKLVINEEEAPWVRQIFEWYIAGWGRAKIARTLTQKGVPTNRGLTEWKEKVIGDILSNPTSTGAVHYKLKRDPENKRIQIPDMHEAIISRDMFDQAQKIFKRRRENDMNLSEYNFAFSTILKCAVCGRSYHGKYSRRTPKRNGQTELIYYRCSGKYRPDSPCSASDIVESKIVKLFFSYVDEFVAKGIDERRELSPNQIDVTKERKRIEKQLVESREKRKKWARAMGEGKMEYEVYTELLNEENTKNEALQKQLGELPEETPTGKKAGDVVNILRNLKTNWHDLSVEDQKRIIQSTFRQIIIGKIESTWRILGIRLSE